MCTLSRHIMFNSAKFAPAGNDPLYGIYTCILLYVGVSKSPVHSLKFIYVEKLANIARN